MRIKDFLMLVLLMTGYVNCVWAIPTDNYITPETYGAKGDGITDDSPAFNRCLASGKTIKLSASKTYVLSSCIDAVHSNKLVIQGNNAELRLKAGFNLKRYESIFRFSSSVKNPELIQLSDVSVNCLYGQKFQDKDSIGDTYIFNAAQCNNVKMTNVNFTCTTLYNNVTFLRSDGGDIEMDNCHITLNTRSYQGGILWLMNQYKSHCQVKLSNCMFEHDAHDEAMCFAVNPRAKIPRVDMNVNVRNCSYYSNGNTPSSGFIISYNHTDGVFMDANIRYKDCTFKTDGLNKRYIQSYQCGRKGSDYGRFNTVFSKCTFDFKLKDKVETGLLGLLPLNGNVIKRDRIGFTMNKCIFNLSNVSTLIGDKDGDTKGYYSFNNCEFKTNGSLFCKKYNKGNGQINIYLSNCTGLSNDETLTTENIKVSNSRFSNNNGKVLYPKGSRLLKFQK